ncbi:hypothetical protein [Phyllobacterium brassicacearum]|uniref:hypothetical protein n=1 Tax=Phyllobacterium brassicacearum TaxID=314235 RepID=UPI001FDFD889|nr:hypothetical protein [Phyllobacterium brassicacearum]
MSIPAFPYSRHSLPQKGTTAWRMGTAILLLGNVATCGRICYKRKKINLSQVFAGQTVGIKRVEDRIWLASFMEYDLGYFDDETCRLVPLPNPFGPKVLPMSQE